MACAEPTLEELLAAVLEWENTIPRPCSIKTFLKQKFPGMTKDHFTSLQNQLTG